MCWERRKYKSKLYCDNEYEYDCNNYNNKTCNYDNGYKYDCDNENNVLIRIMYDNNNGSDNDRRWKW